jgi:hypothetical protein
MNDELQKALAVMLQKTTQATEAGAAFLQAELPDVIRQLLLWHAVRSGVIFIALIIACVALSKWSIAMKNKYVASTEDSAYGGEEGYAIACGALGLCAAGSLICVFNNLAWLQIWLAPKVYLIEYAARLAK